MVGQQELVIGNILLNEFLFSRRNPTFLNRNLTHILRLHEQETRQGKPPQAPVSDLAHKQARWTIPSSETLKAMVEEDNAQKAFVLEIRGVGPLGPQEGAVSQPAQKKVQLFRINVDVHVTIIDPESPARNITRRISEVPMVGTWSHPHKDISLDMQKIVFKVEELLRLRGSKDRSALRKSHAKGWALDVSLHFRDRGQAINFYSHALPIELSSPRDHLMDLTLPPESSLRRDHPMHLVMQWQNILECPPEDLRTQPLAVAGTQKELPLGLKLNMYWTDSTDSILAMYNRRLNSSTPRLLSSTPPSLKKSEPNAPKYDLTFQFSDKTFKTQGLICPYWSHREKTIPSVDYLRSHLIFFHEIECQATKVKEFNGVQYFRIICEVACPRPDQQRASNAAPDIHDHRILAPKQPFNQRRFLDEGNEDFQKAARLEKIGGRVRSQTPGAVAKPAQPKRPDEVQERAKHARKSFKVPQIQQGRTLFRSISKRPLQEGEDISESDEEVDIMNWLQEREDARIDADSSIPAPKKRFLKMFDPFIRNERPQANVHVSDAVLRFARSKAENMWKEEVVVEFEQKLNDLLADRIISTEIHAACLSIVKKHKPLARTSNDLSNEIAHLDVNTSRTLELPSARDRLGKPNKSKRKSDSGKGKTKATDMGHTAPQTTNEDSDIEMIDESVFAAVIKATVNKLQYDQCLCGKDALATANAGAVIVCEHPVRRTRNRLVTLCANFITTGLHSPRFPHRLCHGAVAAYHTTKQQDS